MYTREQIANLLRHYPQLVRGGHLPTPEEVLAQRELGNCASFEQTSVMVADLESALRSLRPWESAIAVMVFGKYEMHRCRAAVVREREGEVFDLTAGDVSKVLHDIMESLFAKMNGLSVSDNALTRPARM